MRFTAPNIIDKFWSSQLKMCILISIFLSHIPLGVIELSNINSRKVEKVLQKLTNVLVQQLLLILMRNDLVFEFLDFLLVFLLLNLL